MASEGPPIEIEVVGHEHVRKLSSLRILNPSPQEDAGKQFSILTPIEREVSDRKLIVLNILVQNCGMRWLQHRAGHGLLDLEGNIDP